MKRISAATLCVLVISGVWSFAGAEKLFSMKIGTTWPQALLSTGIPSGDVEINYGMLVDRKVGFGIAADFLWNTKENEVQDSSSLTAGKFRVVSSQKSFMFPVMGFFLLDPLPDLIVHPVGKFEIGFNSLVFSSKSVDSANTTKINYPYFYGMIIKASIDGLYDIGERSSLFLGIEYQWAKTRNLAKGEFFDRLNMGGIGLRAGFRVLM